MHRSMDRQLYDTLKRLVEIAEELPRDDIAAALEYTSSNSIAVWEGLIAYVSRRLDDEPPF